MNRSMILIGMGIGAALMYALDPQQGNRRRALARDKLTKAVHKTGHAMGATSRDVAHRASGLAASMHTRFFEDNAPDAVVEARVRARLGRVSSHPGVVHVTAADGVITLQGPVFKSELPGILKAIAAVRGVTEVRNRLEPHDVGEHFPALQGRPPRAGTRSGGGEWPPAAKLAVGLAGATLTSVGLVRRDRLGMLSGGIGLALVLRAIGDVGIERLFSVAANRAADVDTSTHGVTIPVRFGSRKEGDAPPEPWPQPPSPGSIH
jgi:hypothetical protein